MRNSQRGVTMVGWAVILAVIGVFALAGIKLVPIYMENLKIVSALKGAKKEFDGNEFTAESVRRSLAARFDIESVKVIGYRDVEISKAGSGGKRVLRAQYDHRTPFLGNVDLIVAFDDQVEITP